MTGGQCVYMLDNNISIGLTSLPAVQRGAAEPSQYRAERTEFSRKLADARRRIRELEQTKQQLDMLNKTRADQTSEYVRIQSEYATYSDAAGATKVIKEVSNSLTPFRPPTAPASDIERERKAIAKATDESMLLIQVALFIVVLVLLTYVIIPGDAAHTIAFLLIVVGIASAFFLRK